MKIPFADLFQKSKARLKPAAPPPKSAAPMPTAKKSESERLAKTVMPSATRTMVAEEEADLGAESSTSLREATAGQADLRDATARQGSTSAPALSKEPPIATEVAVAPTAPAKISMGAIATGPAPHLPPAVAFALSPNIERAISLPLQDVIAQMPEGYLKPRASFDVNRPVFLKAAEIEKGMAAGQPAIPVATLFQQAPDIFMHTVPSSDGAMVALPFERVMNALSSMAVRSDQAAEQAVPQVETPFLQVTIEDTKRFGTPMPSVPAASAAAETEEMLPVRIEPATAEAYAAAVPEAADTFVPAIDAESIGAKRIPFTPKAEPGGTEAAGTEKFGTGEPAFPRVPASSGPPVPPAPSAPAEPPTRIPFNFPSPSDQARKEKDEGGGHRSKNAGNEPVLTLPLRPILQTLPPMQLGGNPATVPAEAMISFPMSMIAPQLASGKVVVTPNAFYAALPEEYRRLFSPGAVDAPVPLSLADILANLPGETLRVRDDQEVHTLEETFETPFSAKAAEDAARFAEKFETLKAEMLKSEAGAKDEGEKSKTVAKFDAKEAVAKACALDGVQSCSVIFSDGLSIAGNVPESMHVDGLSAVAPTLLQKLDKHMLETSLGPLQCMTVHGETAPVSFFTTGNVCLTALHSGEELGAGTRRELARMTEEISRAYSQPSPSRTGGPSRTDRASRTDGPSQTG